MLPVKPQPQNNSALGKKHQKGEDGDLTDGPVKKRRCQDVACLLLFLAHASAFWFLAVQSYTNGKLQHLYLPRDFRGAYCGLANSDGNKSASLIGFTKLSFAMDVTNSMDELALNILCSSAGQALLTEQAKSACSGVSGGSFSASQAASTFAASIANPSKALQLFSGSSGSLLPTPASVMQEASKYLTAVCTTSCNTSQLNRTFVYSPPPNVPWGAAWQELLAAANGPMGSAVQPALSHMKFSAWSFEDCPYDPRYCVPFPGISFTEGPDNLCLPSIAGSIADALGSEITDKLNSLGSLNVTQNALESVDTAVGSVTSTLETYAIVAFVSLVVGLVYMTLARFFTKPLVWLSILLVLFMLLGAGLAAMVRAQQCASDSFFDSGKTLAESTAVSATNSVVSTVQNASGVDVPLHLNITETGSCSEQGGYAVKNSQLRQVLQGFGYALLALAGLWLLLILCMCKRIRLAIAVNEVAAQFVQHNPQVLLVPLLQVLAGAIWLAAWAVVAAFTVSYVPSGYVPPGAFSTRVEAAGNATLAGACNSRWPAGFAYEDVVNCQPGNGSTTAKCWYCAPPRLMLDERFAYAFFSLLWHNALLVAIGQCIIAGAVGTWFFAPRSEKGHRAVCCVAARNALFWSIGSLAFGSMILAIVQFVKWVMRYLSEQAKVHKNRVARLVFRALASCLWCFEKCVKFLNKNAYIQIALRGTSFCTSAQNAFLLIMRNFVRFGAVAMLGPVLALLGVLFICSSTAIAGYFILQALNPDASPVLPVMLYVLIGYVMARLFMNVFALAVDTSLQCFIISEEMEHRGDFVPSALQSFIEHQDLKGGGKKGFLCSCGSCCSR
eukprot:TRINITY_DN33850_c0_g1_i1.p1 TRINITY_DN33850_c0_g1~~TRINITY_DN33850_c0_g1_i1.p1  ORF type:complete len:840 (-),score=149.27 TRINITY_DN33850_c0_g1_i1:49-2568(-)